MDCASSVVSSIERAFGPSKSNESDTSGCRKSGLWSSRSAKCLFLGGLVASYGCSLGGAMESSAGKTADMARFPGNLPLSTSNVDLVPVGGTTRFHGHELARDTEAAMYMNSCMQGIIGGGIGALLVQHPLPLLAGFGGCLPTVSAQQRIGNEFQVNTYAANGQKRPSVASFDNGNFVVTWESCCQDGSNWGVYGQLFGGNANRIGNEFLVNTHTDNWQNSPSAASLSNGNFVVTWESYGQDGSDYGIYGQLFYGNVNRIGNEFPVNTYTTNTQSSPSVASLSNGNFVVTWASRMQDGSDYGVYGQIFDTNATRIGNEFQINTYVTRSQQNPSASSFSNGNFVVAWESYDQDGSERGVYGQLFYGNASRIGNEFQVNMYTVDGQYEPSAASFSNGNFVVAWQSNSQDGSEYGVHGQLFDGNANRTGNEFQVNSYVNNTQVFPSVASFSNGNFVVAWHSQYQDGSEYGVYGQVFDGIGNRIGNEFQVNTYASDDQQFLSVASFSNGNFVVTWESDGQDGSGEGVYGQIFSQDPPLTSSTISTTNEIITSSSSSTLSSANNPPVSSTDETTTSSSSNPSSITGAQSSSSISVVIESSPSNLIGTTETPSTSLPMTFATMEQTLTLPGENSSIIWISLGLIGGILCICLGGGAVYTLKKRKAREDSSNADSSLELSGKDYSPYANIPNRSGHERNYANVSGDQLNNGKSNYANVSYYGNDEYPKGYANVPNVADN